MRGEVPSRRDTSTTLLPMTTARYGQLVGNAAAGSCSSSTNQRVLERGGRVPLGPAAVSNNSMYALAFVPPRPSHRPKTTTCPATPNARGEPTHDCGGKAGASTSNHIRVVTFSTYRYGS